MREYLFLLGAPDAEMAMIERVIRTVDEANFDLWVGFVVAYAESAPGVRLRPGQAVSPDFVPPSGARAFAVEVPGHADSWIDIDHHDPRNPNTAAPPECAVSASSLGQVIQVLAQGVDFRPPIGWRRSSPDAASPPGTWFPPSDPWGSWWIQWGAVGHVEIPSEVEWEARLDHNLAGALSDASNRPMREYAVETRRETFAPHLTKAEFHAALQTATRTLLAAPPALDLGPDGNVRDLTALEPNGPAAHGTGEVYPESAQFLPLVAALAGVGYVVRIRRADGKLAMRVGGCGIGSIPGPEPIQRWLDGVGVARGCAPAEAPRPNNLYGFAERGMGGGTLTRTRAWVEEHAEYFASICGHNWGVELYRAEYERDYVVTP